MDRRPCGKSPQRKHQLIGTQIPRRVIRFRWLALATVTFISGLFLLLQLILSLSGWHSVLVPLDAEYSLQLRRKATHAYLAEYRRTIQVIRAGRTLHSIEYTKDSGGGFPMVFRYHSD